MLRKFNGAFTFCILLAACSNGANTGVAPQDLRVAPRGVLSTSANSGSVLFVADAGADDVAMYPADVNHPAPLGTITNGISDPQSVAVDSMGVLYVANAGNHTITEYRHGQSTPFRTLKNGAPIPRSLAVDSTGNVYAGSSISNSVVLVEYRAGSTAPFRTLSLTNNRGLPFMGGMRVDAQNNLYVAFFIYDIKPGHVLKFAPGATTGVDLQMQGIQEPLTMGLGLDSSGNLYVGNNDIVNVYAAGATAPSRVISGSLRGVEKFFVSSAGAVYAPVYLGSTGSAVEEFAPGSAVPTAEITGLEQPVSVTLG